MQGEKSVRMGRKVVQDRTTDGVAPERIELIEKGLGEEGLNAVVYRRISRCAETFLQHGQRTIYAHDLKKRMEKGERLFLLDIRLSENYAAGHIPGSINAQFIDIMEPYNLAILPKDGTPIILICYTGHTASQLNSILNLLGYNAWTLRFGMMSWDFLTRTSVWSSRDSQVVFGGGFCIADSYPVCGSDRDAHSLSIREQDR
jgi:rhodanese-related sulfurtransferase